MEVRTLSNIFTLFGDFTAELSNLEQLNSIFDGYRINVIRELNDQGKPANGYKYTNFNSTVVIRHKRLDIELKYTNETTTRDFMMFVKDTTAKLSSISPFLSNRIALNTIEFLPDPDFKLVRAASRVFSVDSIYGSESDEFSVRLNHVTPIANETFNSIVMIQDGAVQNGATRENMHVLLINKDLNTRIENKDVRFSLSSHTQYLFSMLMEADKKTTAFLSKLDPYL